jgi:hypothetical protein
MTSPWQEWKKKNAERQETGVVRPWDLANPDTEYATDDEQEYRYSVCQECPHLTAAKTCTKCGCLMPIKTKLLHATCPIGKWGVKS